MILQVQKVSKMFAATPILSEISLQLEERERVGLIGLNGAGKSTILKLITGQLSPDQGQIMFAKGTTVGYLEQAHGLNGQNGIWQELLSVFAPLVEMQAKLHDFEIQLSNPLLLEDEIGFAAVAKKYDELSEQFRRADGYSYETKMRSVLHGMGFAEMSLDTLIDSLSGGQKTRLALAKLLLRQPDLLILDEPTNHLDIETLEWLESYLSKYPGSLLVVSHDRFFLDAVVNITYELERSQTRRYAGNYSFYVAAKALEYEQQLKEYDRQQANIARLEDFVKRNIARASTTKRAQSRRKTLESIDRLDRPQGERKKAHFSFEIERRSGKDVLKAEDLSLAFADKPALFESLHLLLTRGESVALLGPNGVGKSSLLKMLVGQLPIHKGVIQWGTGVRIGYFDQEQRTLNPEKTVLDEVWDAFPQLEEVSIRTVLGNFLFSGEDVFKKISTLSGGEKARVSLAKLMLDKANVLILDEPTNHLDVHSKEILEEALFDFEGTLLFISHDRYFINRLAEKIIELTPKGLNIYPGDYDEYQIKKQTALPAANVVSEKVSSYAIDKKAKRDERAIKRRLEQIEAEIAAIEEEIAELELSLLDPAEQQNYQFLQQVSDTLERRKSELTEKYDLWQQWME